METKSDYQRKTYYFLKERGICVDCGKEKAFQNHVKCPACIEKDIERYHKRKAFLTTEDKNRKRKINKTKYYEHKEKGLCVRCDRKAAPGHVYCNECRVTMKRSNSEWRIKVGKNNRYAECGLCIRCGAEPVEGRKLCYE